MQNSKKLVEEIKKYFEKRFGLSRKIWGHHIIILRNEIGWLINPQLHDWIFNIGNKAYSLGIPFVRLLPKGIKPTSWGLIFMGREITRNIIELGLEDLRGLLYRGRIKGSRDIETGYVALGYNGEIIGCGFYKDGVLENQIPKARRKSLLEILPQLK